MFRPSNPQASERRRAVILMVVLVLLTLFAIVGLAFVLYANSEADSSRVYREALIRQDNRPDIGPDTLASWALGQMLFDVQDPNSANNPGLTSGVGSGGGWSAARGHSLGRDMYGWDADLPGSNIYPFNGVGHLHSTVSNPWNVDDHALLSYVPYPGDGFIRDPERLGTRASLGVNGASYTAGWNSSYTYPDGNHVFLGAFDADGNVLARSFWRPYLLPPTMIGGNPSNNVCLPLNPADPTYWTWFVNQNPNNPAETVPPQIRYSSLRLRNADMAVGFPAPGLGGDVQNLPGPGGFDSVWVDLDYPIQVGPDGTKFKPLFAFFIADLDGRVNLNAHGNIRGVGAPPVHLSNQGWGKWEINLGKVLIATTGAAAQAEWPQLFVGANNVSGRYGLDGLPAQNAILAPSGRSPHVGSQVDYDGSDDSAAARPAPPPGLPAGVGGVPTGPILLPGAGAAAYMSFPNFPAGYNNGTNFERTAHPLNYNSELSGWMGSDDRRFPASNLVGLFNSGAAQSPANPNGNPSAALSTDLGKVLQSNMTSFRIRNMSTTDSAGLERPGLTPWIYDRNNLVLNTYGYAGGASPFQAPSGNPVPFGALNQRGNPLPANPATELSVDWRALDAALGKVNLNRFLSPYPHQGSGNSPTTFGAALCNPNDRFDTPGAISQQWQWAVQDRQKLADDIYRRLLKVTGVPAPANPANPTAAELAPRRWLAQLSVNIVDFIDEDEISTPFNFYNPAEDNGGQPLTNPAGIAAKGTATTVNPAGNNANDDNLPIYWVFGTELPRVVVNEVMAEYQTNAVAGQPFPVKVFVELFNPLPSKNQVGGNYPNTIDQLDKLPTPLYYQAAGVGQPAYSPYKLFVADTNPNNRSAGLLNPPNDNDSPLGRPNWVRGQYDFSDVVKNIDNSPAANGQIAAVSPQQYFLVVPGIGFDAHGAVNPAGVGNGVVPTQTPTQATGNMTYNVKQPAAGAQWQSVGPNPANGSNITDGPNGIAATSGISVLLRRLANPHLPYDANPANVTYNPYITVDYMKGVMPQDETTPATGTSVSYAKRQPYAANDKYYLPQAAPAAGATTCTFGQPNDVGSMNPGQFNWLVHLDRQVTSPLELLHVSGYQPHHLTQRFVVQDPNNAANFLPYSHRANWYDEKTRLYRIFEFLNTRDRAAGVSAFGRRPGMININTVWNQEVFRALADAQKANGFYVAGANTDATVDGIFQNLLKSRSPGYAPGVGGVVTGKDRPFLGMGIGVMPPADTIGGVNDDGTPKPNNTGIEDTFLRSDGGGLATSPRLFDVPGNKLHPYARNELMQKIFGNVTTRSNCFAVWVTVGFFRVPDPVSRVGGNGPVIVAEEIGAATGTNIRHQFFAVVDRTHLTIARRQLTTTTTMVLPAVLQQPTTVTLTAINGTTGVNQVPWQVQAGTILVIDPGTPAEETVVVQSVAGNVVTATFEQPHGIGARVTIQGNPGPQPTWAVTNPGYAGLLQTYAVLK